LIVNSKRGGRVGYYNRGLALYDMRQYDRAIRELDHAVNVRPN